VCVCVQMETMGQLPRTGRPLDVIRIPYGNTNLVRASAVWCLTLMLMIVVCAQLFVFGGYDNDTKMPMHELRSTDLFTNGALCVLCVRHVFELALQAKN
jgi:hypothetical protein